MDQNELNEPLDDYITIDLQPREAVVNRLIVLRAFVERSLLEATAEDEDDTDEIEERRFDLLAALLNSDAAASVTSEELALLQMPIGQIPDDEDTAILLAAESYGAIGKACGLIRDIPLPPNPVGSSEELLQQILLTTPEEIEAEVSLPSDEEAAVLLEIMEVIHWRVDVEFGARLNDGTLTPEEKESIAAVAKEAELSGLLQTYPSGDLKLGHKPVRKWTDDEVETYYVVSLQQRNALMWLCSAGQEWELLSEEAE